MVGTFGHEHLGDGRLGRDAALDQPGLHRRLLDDALGIVGKRIYRDAHASSESDPRADGDSF